MTDLSGNPELMQPGARKTVLRTFTYGMYAISAASDGQRGIFTANWLTQVSFDPPMIAVSIESDSSTLHLIRESGRFVVSPLRSDQTELARDLGRPAERVGDKFERFALPLVETASGEAALASALGYAVCDVRLITEAGDSFLVTGEVVEVRVLESGEPLTMRAAGFRHAG